MENMAAFPHQLQQKEFSVQVKNLIWIFLFVTCWRVHVYIDYVFQYSFTSTVYLLGIACKVTSVEMQTAVTWVTQNFKRGRESNRHMSWRDSWTFSSRIEACNESTLTYLSEAFNQFYHLIHIRMHIQLSLPQHCSSTDVKAQVLSPDLPICISWDLILPCRQHRPSRKTRTLPRCLLSTEELTRHC